MLLELFLDKDIRKLASFQYAMKVRCLFLRELHDAFHGRVERVILGAQNAFAWMDLGAALTDDDLSLKRVLTIGDLHAQTLTGRVASKLCRTACFFMGHKERE